MQHTEHPVNIPVDRQLPRTARGNFASRFRCRDPQTRLFYFWFLPKSSSGYLGGTSYFLH